MDAFVSVTTSNEIVSNAEKVFHEQQPVRNFHQHRPKYIFQQSERLKLPCAKDCRWTKCKYIIDSTYYATAVI